MPPSLVTVDGSGQAYSENHLFLFDVLKDEILSAGTQLTELMYTAVKMYAPLWERVRERGE
jgi:hypothetical protein